jgi:DNA-binding CsgD family transcriptional regulator
MSRIRERGPGDARVVGRGPLLVEVAASLAGATTATCLVGEPGVGKTSVWSATLEAVREPVAVRLTCFDAESGLGWTVLADLLSGLVASLGEDQLVSLPPAQRLAADVILLRASADRLAVPLDSRLAGSVLLSLLRVLPDSLIAIDDVQWCDAQSYEAICFALRREQGSNARWLISRRPSGERALPGEHVIVVPPMDAVDLRAVIAERTGRILAPAVLDQLVQVSGGNPFYALEIARSLPVECTVDDVLDSPTVSELVAARLSRLPTATSRALVDVAVQATVTRDYERVAALDSAFDMGVLGWTPGRRISFTHPLLAAGVLATAPPGVLAAAHRRAAQGATEAVGRARHVAAATSAPDEGVAAQLDDAVKEAVSRGDVNGAAWLAERALAVGTEPSLKWARLAAATRTATKAFDPRAEQWARELVALSAPGEQRAIAYLALSVALVRDMVEALAAAQRGLEEPALDDQLRAEVLSQIAGTLITLGRLDDAADALQAAQAMHVEGHGWADAVGTWAVASRVCGRPVDLELLTRAAEHARRSKWSAEPIVALGVIAAYDDRHDDARAAYTEAIAITDAAGIPDEARFRLAELQIRTGEVAAAAQLARELVAVSDWQDLAANTCVLAMALAWLGDEEASRAAAAQSREASLAASDELFWVGSDVAVGLLEISLDHYEAAWSLLEPAMQAMQRWHLEDPSIVPGIPLGIEAAVALGRLDEARELLNRLETQGEQLDSRWAGAAALRSRAHIEAGQDPSSALTLFADAASAFEQLRLPLEQARALLARGRLARRDRQRRAARADLNAALQIFEHHDAKILAARTRDELTKLGGRAASGPELTASELATAQLAASGLTNTQIARQLSVSVKTVETHLGHAFHKLGVHSRVQLANAIAGSHARPASVNLRSSGTADRGS